LSFIIFKDLPKLKPHRCGALFRLGSAKIGNIFHLPNLFQKNSNQN